MWFRGVAARSGSGQTSWQMVEAVEPALEVGAMSEGSSGRALDGRVGDAARGVEDVGLGDGTGRQASMQSVQAAAGSSTRASS